VATVPDFTSEEHALVALTLMQRYGRPVTPGRGRRLKRSGRTPT
jgi:hypothetical protein